MRSTYVCSLHPSYYHIPKILILWTLPNHVLSPSVVLSTKQKRTPVMLPCFLPQCNNTHKYDFVLFLKKQSCVTYDFASLCALQTFFITKRRMSTSCLWRCGGHTGKNKCSENGGKSYGVTRDLFEKCIATSTCRGSERECWACLNSDETE
jgi:hypothetical protein